MTPDDLGHEELSLRRNSLRDAITFLRGQIDRLAEEHDLAVAELVEKET